LGFIKTELLDQLNDYQLMKNSIPCSLLWQNQFCTCSPHQMMNASFLCMF
jgi:hypothetical protein